MPTRRKTGNRHFTGELYANQNKTVFDADPAVPRLMSAFNVSNSPQGQTSLVPQRWTLEVLQPKWPSSRTEGAGKTG